MTEADEFKARLRRDGWLHHPDACLTPLRGGVSSEIYLVVDGAERFVVKRALPRLRVRDDWQADPQRNVTEWKYLECVGRILPGAVPQLRFANPEGGYFGMEYLGEAFANWKQLLLCGVCEPDHARMAGRLLGTIHRATVARPDLLTRFDTRVNFQQLRIAPYLLTTGARHRDLQRLYAAEAERLLATRECLVHGDFSPKNMLIQGGRLVLLDCEVAWYGAAAFDVAFLLTHLCLKALHHAPGDLGIAGMLQGFWQAYHDERPRLTPEFEPAVVRLLALLLLARVDGKSPVEYLDSTRKAFIRNFVPSALTASIQRLDELSGLWFDQAKALAPAAART